MMRRQRNTLVQRHKTHGRVDEHGQLWTRAEAIIQWTSDDEADAMREGWLLVNVDGTNTYEIERYDDDPTQRFKTDDETLQFVRRRADHTFDMHMRALNICDRWPYRRN
jgi:hypothetical protein